MIESIGFRNFKVLRDTTLALGRFTFLVGPNGSGKSTALKAFGALQSVSSCRFDTLASAGLLPTEGAEVEVTVSWGDPNKGLSVKGIWQLARGGSLSWTRPAQNSSNGHSQRDAAASDLHRIRIYSLDPSRLAVPVALHPVPELTSEGDQLAGVLDRLRDRAPERFEELNRELGRMLPEFDRILFDTPSNGQRSFLLRTRRGGHVIPAVDLSHGTLLALAIITLAYLPDPPPLIGLEEPDRGIHPRLLRDVRDALYRLSYPSQFGESRPPVQVVATTQSPYFLDLFKEHPEEIVIAQKEGLEARFERLSDRPDIEEILADAPLGEVWYSGVLGGVPG